MQETQVSSLGQEDPAEEGDGYSLQYFCLEDSTDRGAWQATVHGVTKSWTRLSYFHFQTQVQLTFSVMGNKLLPLTKQ